MKMIVKPIMMIKKVQLPQNALDVLIHRYSLRDEQDRPVEMAEQIFARVALVVAEAENQYVDGMRADEVAEKFYEMLVDLRFMPNGRTIANAGTAFGQLANCYVLPIDDEMGKTQEGIFSTLKHAALILQAGGGVGFSFGRIRPKGDKISTSKGKTTGAVSFIKIYDRAFDIIGQGGGRRSACMAILPVGHPDIWEFIHCKEKEGEITNFNISVGITDAFMKTVRKNGIFDLVNPHNGKVWEKVKARKLFDELVRFAHHNGEPGVVFLDTANRDNPVPHLYKLEATNPCVTGEILVAVADGRDAVPISQLAKDGKDVPVYCQGIDGITIRWGRRPRKTRSKVSVFKVTLDDGSFIRATADHRFMLRDGSYKQLKQLKTGDRLMPFNKHEYLQDRDQKRRYWAVMLNQPGNNVAWAPEHRLVMEFANEEKIRYPEKVVHHKDFNGLNNRFDNLEVMRVEDHDRLHKERMLGDSNPMRKRWWGQLTEEEKANYRQRFSDMLQGAKNPRYGVELSSELRKRIKDSVRQYWLDPVKRIEHGNRVRSAMTDVVRAKISAARMGEREICKCANPGCGDEFEVTVGSRQKYHDHVCGTWAGREIYAVGIEKRHMETSNAQVELGVGLKKELGRLPLKREFMEVAKIRGVNPHVWYYWGDYDVFLDSVQQVNHRIISIKPDGNEDVYNITVDEWHNLAYITNSQGTTRTGNRRLSGVITANCAEQALGPYENCCLGSINLARHVRAANGKWQMANRKNLYPCEIDWEKLEETCRWVTRFLDDVVDANKYVPAVPQLEEAAKRNRRIGVSIMGLADMMYKLGVRYGSEEGEDLAGQVMEFITYNVMTESIKLAKERGSFSGIRGSIYDRESMTWKPKKPLAEAKLKLGRPKVEWSKVIEGIKEYGIRNAAQTTIAPTGAIATISGLEGYGCEPVFGLSYVMRTHEGAEEGKEWRELAYESRLFREALERVGLSEGERSKIFEKVRAAGSCQGIEEVPEEIRRVFVVAGDISGMEHVRMQAALQRFVDNSISKTINLPTTATEDDVKEVYFNAWELGCKGMTVYVTGSRETVVLETPKVENCPECGSGLRFEEGCATCPNCAYSHCSV